MEKYFSHFTAARVWDIPHIDDVLGFRLSEYGSEDITVSDSSARFKYNSKLVHACKLKLPADAVIERDGKMVASPELLFLELANRLSIQRLILLGLQLCSFPPGEPFKAITTKQKLIRFLAKAQGQRGHRKALRAVKYLEDGSASVMESLTYMFLTLPHTLGGYGLSGAVFNHQIRIKGGIPTHFRQRSCFADLYYKQAKIAVEYESYAYHSRPQDQGKDAIRSIILNRQGIRVLHMNTIQLYDIHACNDFAHALATRLGKRIQVRTNDFVKMCIQMRELLPRTALISKSIDKDNVTMGDGGLGKEAAVDGEF